ncbi:dual oxidase maturation factor 1-like [Tachypleus tridentatus]|uniref:dual oxidase maturation factor 1-like n=1 Tax=Tachypleus tridentatus TaxID=6853 RepID=UPI003FD3A67F
MVNGWFDAFRVNGGPTLYHVSNRTAVIQDIRNVIIYITFTTFFVAFLIVFPGIRKERLTTIVSVTISLFVGAVILISNYGTDWHVAETTVSSLHRASSREKVDTYLGVYIGLNSMNVTLQATDLKPLQEINYNERFNWVGATEMKETYQQALVKGLPFPILTIAEYLSQDLEGFSWGRQYRQAGYYSYILLWTAFALWLLMNILLCTVPRYGAYCMQLTGVIMLLTNIIYALLLPQKPLVIPFEGGTLAFRYGWCFWLLLSAGIISFLVGLIAAVVDIVFPHKFSTIIEVDYDSPYRHFAVKDIKLKRELRSKGYQRNSKGLIPKDGCYNLGSSTLGIDNAAFENDDKDANLMVNGKKAISLHDFGNYIQQEETPKEAFSAMNRNMNNSENANGTHQIKVELESAAMW